MLQRIQSVYLLASLALSILPFFIPVGFLSDGITEMQLTPYGLKDSAGTVMSDVQSYFFYVPLTATISFVLISIFSFKNRKAQMKWVRMTFILIALTIALIALYIKDATNMHSALNFSLGFGLFMPILALAFNRLALRAIQKDEDLIKSVDRIR